MIKVRNLRISFNGRPIIENADFDVPAGSTVVLMGKNGSGKSVILKTIAGLIPEFTGEISINGTDIREFYRNREKMSGHRAGEFRLAYVFQKGGLFDSMNVYDNVAFGLTRTLIDAKTLHDRVSSSLERVGLAGSEGKLPSELSGGMQKRAGLARAICLDPGIILYDDPTAGLDPILSDSIADLMGEIRDNGRAASLTVTHDLKVAEKIADTILLLYGGRIVFSGTGADFFSKKNPFARQFIEGDIDGPIDIL